MGASTPGARARQGREHARGALDTHAGRVLNSGYEAGEDEHSIDLSQNKGVLVSTYLQTKLIRCSFELVGLCTITHSTLASKATRQTTSKIWLIWFQIASGQGNILFVNLPG